MIRQTVDTQHGRSITIEVHPESNRVVLKGDIEDVSIEALFRVDDEGVVSRAEPDNDGVIARVQINRGTGFRMDCSTEWRRGEGKPWFEPWKVPKLSTVVACSVPALEQEPGIEVWASGGAFLEGGEDNKVMLGKFPVKADGQGAA